MRLRQALFILHAVCLVGLVVPFALGYSYTGRLATRPSLYQIKVPDQLARPPAASLPRRAAVVVIDGLGYKEALGMRATQFLRARGQCWKTDVGPLSISRPVYGVLSTGVEQDRGGALVNDTDAPHAAGSLWELARAAGLSVAAVSELTWWQELFPRGFSSYQTPPRSADYFRLAPAADLLLLHPLYVDEIGHTDGAASAAYREAVARADRELLGLLDKLELQRDLIVFTADHGHSLSGGHGGVQDRVANVLTCFAGAGVEPQPALAARRMTSVGPALTLLLGLPFPDSMRAGDDELDALWQLADPLRLGSAYLTERRQALQRFRAANRAELTRLCPTCGGSWTTFYAAARARAMLRALPLGAGVALLLALHFRGHRRLRGARGAGGWFGLLWLLGCLAAAYGLQVLLRGSFDMSSVNNRFSFIRFTVALGLAVTLGGLGLHLLVRRSPRALIWDLTMLSLLGTVLSLGQPLVYGWHLDFPVPPPQIYFFPYFAALFFGTLNAVALLIGLFDWADHGWLKLAGALELTSPEV
jgi:hypothetical protein